jgi:hypothetical protein
VSKETGVLGLMSAEQYFDTDSTNKQALIAWTSVAGAGAYNIYLTTVAGNYGIFCRVGSSLAPTTTSNSYLINSAPSQRTLDTQIIIGSTDYAASDYYPTGTIFGGLSPDLGTIIVTIDGTNGDLTLLDIKKAVDAAGYSGYCSFDSGIFALKGSIRILSTATSGSMITKNKIVGFVQGRITNGSTSFVCQFGSYNATVDVAYDGCTVLVFSYSGRWSVTNIKYYDCLFKVNYMPLTSALWGDDTSIDHTPGTTGGMRGCILDACGVREGNVPLSNITILHAPDLRFYTTGTYQNLTVIDSYGYIYSLYTPAFRDCTFLRKSIAEHFWDIGYGVNQGGDINLYDVTFDDPENLPVVRVSRTTSVWIFNVYYTLDLSVNDSAGSPVQSARVGLYNASGVQQFNLTTLSTGKIANQDVLAKKVTCTGIVGITRAVDNYNVFALKVRKYGYQFGTLSLTFNAKIATTSYISINPFTVASESAAATYTGITIDGSAKTITITEPHTMQELYDYSQWWACQSANMQYAEPITTADGGTYASDYSLTIDGCALSGSGRLNLGSNALTLANNGSSLVTITAAGGTYTTIQLTGLVSGSRVQLYDLTSATELHNAVVNASTLTVPAIWTADHAIRVRVMYVAGGTAKRWYESSGTLTANGMSLNVAQEDDAVYNTICIDGSTVTECSISGTNLIIDVDDPDNTTTAQRLYAFEVYWLGTEDGIRDQALYIEATDSTHFVFEGGLKVKNSKTAPLQLTGGNIIPASGPATDVMDMTGGPIFLNFNRVEGFPYMTQGGLTSEEHDKLFSVADDVVKRTRSNIIALK